LLIAASICGTGPSRAADSPLQLDYAADSTCPDRSAFAELVEQRVQAAGVEAAFATAEPVKVSLVADSSEFVGQLEIVRRDGSRYQRGVRGASCDEVAHALAFVLALTLTATELPPSPAPKPPQAVEPTQRVPTRAPEPPVEKRRSPWGYGVGVQLGARAGIAPDWALVQGAFLEVRRTTAEPLAFSLRAAFLRAPTVNYSDSNGTTDFSWWAVRLEGCPLRLHWRNWLEMLPCAGTHLGRIQATGQPWFGSSVSQSRTWVDAFAAARLELAVARWLSIQAPAELLVPLTRSQFAFDNPDTSVYQVPALGGAAFGGIEVRFP